MKKAIVYIFVALMVFSSCADYKTFKKQDGTEFVAQPYGWMNDSKKIDGVEYDVCAGNVVWSVLLGETVIAPLLFTGLALWEPVYYVDPETKEKTYGEIVQ